jgi:hypothetical protein
VTIKTTHSGLYRPNLAVKNLKGKLVATSSQRRSDGKIAFWNHCSCEHVELEQKDFDKYYRLEELK